MLLLPNGAKSEIVSQINAANSLPVPVTEADFFLGATSINQDGSVKLPTVTMYDSAYEGYVDFTYKRINLTQIFGDIRPQISAVGYTSLHELLPIINEAVGINLSVDDINNVTVQWLGNNETVNILVSTKPNSMGFEGSFVVRYTKLRILLSNALKVKNLDILRQVQKDPAKRSVDIHTWGIDFSDYSKQLEVLGGTYRFLAQVKAAMATMGFANWPTPARADLAVYATKNNANANKAFSTVVVQKNVVGPDYAGTAYIHYSI